MSASNRLLVFFTRLTAAIASNERRQACLPALKTTTAQPYRTRHGSLEHTYATTLYGATMDFSRILTKSSAKNPFRRI